MDALERKIDKIDRLSRLNRGLDEFSNPQFFSNLVEKIDEDDKNGAGRDRRDGGRSRAA